MKPLTKSELIAQLSEVPGDPIVQVFGERGTVEDALYPVVSLYYQDDPDQAEHDGTPRKTLALALDSDQEVSLGQSAIFAIGDPVTIGDPDLPADAGRDPAVVTKVFEYGHFPFPGEHYGEYVGDELESGQFYLVELDEGGEVFAGQADLRIATTTKEQS